LTYLAGYIPRWFTRSHTVTHPSTNRARRRVTSLIETNALPLSHATNILPPFVGKHIEERERERERERDGQTDEHT